MRILDTHLHLVYPDRFSYPWLSGAPAINRPWTVEAYFEEAAALGITSALHMEVDVAEKDMLGETQFVLGLPGVVGAIAACRPEHPDFLAHIERLSDMPHVKGVRRILHESPDELSRTDLFVDNLRALPDYNLSFDLCLLARQLDIGIAHAQSAPDTQFILDHCGNPRIAEGEFDFWAEKTSMLAGCPNVAVKISGIITNAAPGWNAEDLRPYVEHLIEAFGWTRVVWGSDHPVATLNGTLTQWVEATHKLLEGCSEDEKAALLHRNAERIYRV